ncbi:MAG: CHAT domain-containing protein [Actinomycetota bacterium]
MFNIRRATATLKKFLKSLHSSIWLGVITCLLVITIMPAIAQNPPTHINLETATPLLEQGRTFYQSGRFAEAAEVWQQVANESEQQGDPLKLAQCLNYLALAYQELGQWQQATTAIAKSLNLIQQVGTNHKETTLLFAKALNTQGSIQLGTGQTETAFDTWKQAEAAYTKAGDEMGALGSKINQAQAMQTLGMYRRAQAMLEQLNQTLQAQSDSLLKATGLRSLGVALSVVGDLGKAEAVLKQSLVISQQLNNSLESSAILFSLGNTARTQKKFDEALAYYQQATMATRSTTAKLEATLNQISLFIETQQLAKAAQLLPEIYTQVANLPPSRTSVYLRVSWAHNSLTLANLQEVGKSQAVLEILTTAVQQSRMLKDPRAESSALGELGLLYQQKKQWEDASNLTQKALLISQGINAPDLAARWQWQLGQILKKKGDLKGAIAAYIEAVNTLQSLRSDLVAINPDVQFSFRESVEPVYRQLVGLLLQPNAQNSATVPVQNLQQARQLIEALQLAELDNFFREACLNAKPQQIDQVDPTAAVIYPIILPDRLEVILSLPGKPLQHYTTQLPQTVVEKDLDQLLEAFNPVFSSPERLRLSQKVYDWLIRPAEVDLANSAIKTLVFVLDGSLRNLPMAALYDGKQYLVEKYSIALAPGLQLLAPRSLVRGQFKALTAGLTEPRQGFSALPGVKLEVNQISSEVPSQVFLDRDFTEINLQKQLRGTSYPVIHLATHGQFSSNPEETFILTWDNKIKVKEFESLLRSREQSQTNPIELLVLSACQTAAGDKRAALGLAGVAVRSGARSTLATLWSVKDQSTADFMTEFYRDIISPGMSKAEAIRQAQLALLKNPQFQHPFYWAPFILVGNWL